MALLVTAMRPIRNLLSTSKSATWGRTDTLNAARSTVLVKSRWVVEIFSVVDITQLQIRRVAVLVAKKGPMAAEMTSTIQSFVSLGMKSTHTGRTTALVASTDNMAVVTTVVGARVSSWAAGGSSRGLRGLNRAVVRVGMNGKGHLLAVLPREVDSKRWRTATDLTGKRPSPLRCEAA